MAAESVRPTGNQSSEKVGCDDPDCAFGIMERARNDACCAHLRVEFWPIDNEDGTKTERWVCSDLCGQEFVRNSAGSGHCESCGGPHHNHTLGRLRFAVRATRTAKPTSLAARLRMLWQDFVVHGLFGPGGEVCQDCGRSYVLWRADDVLYEAIVGDLGGLLCPNCFDGRAHANGMLLRWHPEIVEADLDDGEAE